MHVAHPGQIAKQRNFSPASRAGFGMAAAIAAILLASMSPARGGWVMTLLMWGTAALSAVRPFDGLLVLAGLGPIVTILSILIGADVTRIHFSEAIVIAFVLGASLHRTASAERPAVPSRVAWPAVLLIGAAAASALVQSALLAAEQPVPVTTTAFVTQLARDYLVEQNTVIIAIQFALGLLLLLLATDICARMPQRRERVLVMMIAGASGAGVLNVVRLITASMRHDNVWATFVGYLGSARVNVQYPDWNAAGSYFALVLLITAGFVAARRFIYLVPLALIGAALWLTGSRVALAAVPVTLAAMSVLLLRRAQRRRNVAIAIVLAVAFAAIAAGWLWYPTQRNDPAAFSVSTRLELWKAGFRMMATDPLFGVGLGRFYVLSPEYAAGTLQTIWRPHENAHNYFIQVLAELGVPGLILFLTVIASSLAAVLRRATAAGPLWGLAVGLVAFLLTCLTGHSLVVPDAAAPFWLALGVAASTAQPQLAAAAARRWVRPLAAAAIVLVAVSVPSRIGNAVRNANRENTVIGMSGWQRDESATRFRWAGGKSTFFVQSSGRAIRIPLRRGPDAPATLQVRVFFDGKEAERAMLQGTDWQSVRLVRPRQGSDGAFFRIDLEAGAGDDSGPIDTAGARVVMVGQPSIVWDK